MWSILSAGVQTTLQGDPRMGRRHQGVPWAGPADPWSMALANRLVGNETFAVALEVSFGGFTAEIDADCHIALAGAVGKAIVDGNIVPEHTTLFVKKGATLTIEPPQGGARTYVAVAGGFAADNVMGSPSTYLPADLGGYQGRVLATGDSLKINPSLRGDVEPRETPTAFRPAMTDHFTVRAVESAETTLLEARAVKTLVGEAFRVGPQVTRMGLSLTGHPLSLRSEGKMKSAAVFPGTVQCPEGGDPIILLVDAQTTGGYPRVAHIARCDRHLLGQIPPRATVRLLHRTAEQATEDLKRKLLFLRQWVPDMQLW